MYCCVPFSHCFSISSSTTAADGVVVVVTTAGGLAVATAGGLAVATAGDLVVATASGLTVTTADGLVVGKAAGGLVVTITGCLAAVAASDDRFVVRRLTVLSRDAIVVRTVEVSSEVLACCVKTSTLLGELAPSYTSVLAATF